MRYQDSIKKSTKGVTRDDLFDGLLSSLGVDAESDVKAEYEKWLREGPTWQKEIMSMSMCLLGGEPHQNQALTHTVWETIEALPAGERDEVDRQRVRREFQKVITASDELSGEIKERFRWNLSSLVNHYENHIREGMGLAPLEEERIDPELLPEGFRGNYPR